MSQKRDFYLKQIFLKMMNISLYRKNEATIIFVKKSFIWWQKNMIITKE